jgi:hypothetical protein
MKRTADDRHSYTTKEKFYYPVADLDPEQACNTGKKWKNFGYTVCIQKTFQSFYFLDSAFLTFVLFLKISVVECGSASL